MNLIDMTVEAARGVGADSTPIRIGEIHEAFLRLFPNATTGRKRSSFDATLNYHTINMQSRFHKPKNKTARDDWMTKPFFKRVGNGTYMLLSPAEIAWFKERLAAKDPLIFESEYDVGAQMRG